MKIFIIPVLILSGLLVICSIAIIIVALVEYFRKDIMIDTKRKESISIVLEYYSLLPFLASFALFMSVNGVHIHAMFITNGIIFISIVLIKRFLGYNGIMSGMDQ